MLPDGSAGALYLISRLHQGATHLTDRYFNRELDRAERTIGAAILKAKKPLEVDRLLAERPFRLLKLSSAAFRRNGADFRRDGHGWDEQTTKTLSPDTPMLAPVSKGNPFSIADEDQSEPGLPAGFSRPVLAVPAANPLRCFALTLYGPHASGADLDANERAMLKRIAQDAAVVYAPRSRTTICGTSSRCSSESCQQIAWARNPRRKRSRHGAAS